MAFHARGQRPHRHRRRERTYHDHSTGHNLDHNINQSTRIPYRGGGYLGRSGGTRAASLDQTTPIYLEPACWPRIWQFGLEPGCHSHRSPGCRASPCTREAARTARGAVGHSAAGGGDRAYPDHLIALQRHEWHPDARAQAPGASRIRLPASVRSRRTAAAVWLAGMAAGAAGAPRTAVADGPTTCMAGLAWGNVLPPCGKRPYSASARRANHGRKWSATSSLYLMHRGPR